MTDPQWIEIVDWDKFQHYRDRNPPWIKNYTELLADDDYLRLSGHRRAILHGLWLEYAMSRRKLRDNSAMISSRLGLRVTSRDLKALNDAGFITLSASAPLAPRYQDASASRAREEAEKEKEKETPLPPFQKTRRSRAKTPAARIAAMIANGVITDTVALDAELTAQGVDDETARELRTLITPSGNGEAHDLDDDAGAPGPRLEDDRDAPGPAGAHP